MMESPSSKSEEELRSSQKKVQRKLLRAASVCLLFVFIEIIGGIKAGSLAIMSDAAHLFTDFLSLLIAAFASYLASLPATQRYNFGLKRVESLAALFSILSLLGVTFYLAYEAIFRCSIHASNGSLFEIDDDYVVWKHPQRQQDDDTDVHFLDDDIDLYNENDRDLYNKNGSTNEIKTDGDEIVTVVDGAIMSGTALLGVLVNIIMALLLGEDHVHMPGAIHNHGPNGSCSHVHASGFMCAHELVGPETESEQEMMCISASSFRSETDKESSSDEEKGGDISKMRFASSIMRPIGSIMPMQPSYELVRSKNEEQEIVDLQDTPSCNETDKEFLSDDEEVPSPSLRFTSSIMRPIGSLRQEKPTQPPRQEKNLNLQAAYLHVLADLAQSVAVLITGCVIWLRPGWYILDPILTIVFSILVVFSSMGIIRHSISVLLEEVPSHIAWQDVYDSLSKVRNVKNIHHLHIWSISPGEIAMNVHCVSEDPSALRNLYSVANQFGIKEATIQIQKNLGVCITCQGNEKRSLPSGFAEISRE